MAKARRLRKRSLTWREYFARGHPKQARNRSRKKAEGEGFEPSSDETARNGFLDSAHKCLVSTGEVVNASHVLPDSLGMTQRLDLDEQLREVALQLLTEAGATIQASLAA